MTTNETPDPDDLVAEHFGHHYTAEHLMAALQTAAELIRFANHATLNNPRETLPWASITGTAVGAILALSAGLDQLCAQIADRVEMLADQPELYHDGIGGQNDPKITLIDAATELRTAAAWAASLRRPLTSAQSAVCRIGHRVND